MSEPKSNTELVGHEEAEALLLGDVRAGRLAHGWIIGGPRGIGKATLAYRFARMLLAGANTMDLPAEHPVFRRVAAGSHADLLVVEPAYDTKKEERAREISVEQAREVARFLALTPGEGEWRVVIVDAADALGTGAANAILKILEEPPPQSVLMLVAHNPGRLLPTIRSRCRTLKLAPLSAERFAAVMRYISPGIDNAQLPALGLLSDHAPGIALELQAQSALETYGELLELVAALPQIDSGALHAFAERFSGSAVHSNWQLVNELILRMLERTAWQAAGIGGPAVSPREAEVLGRLAALHPSAIWAAKWQQAADQFSLASRLHLDYKQVTITFFHSIATKEGFQIGNLAA